MQVEEAGKKMLSLSPHPSTCQAMGRDYLCSSTSQRVAGCDGSIFPNNANGIESEQDALTSEDTVAGLEVGCDRSFLLKNADEIESEQDARPMQAQQQDLK
ncbi:hypothetical protein CRG98_036442 [Punica granatum]|uniref:Uncharacterized protein n=1 Tax=Punica granatum TaxID=22663 RepID=A0A2I0III7_PUNGR|nr:hypothetical protein CRG98_036442 [Punica granatum]